MISIRTTLSLLPALALPLFGAAVDWEKQAAEDAKQDKIVVAYDGILPNRHVGDVVPRILPDGRIAIYFATGGDSEPAPENFVAVIYSEDNGDTWTPMQMVDTGIKREGNNIGQLPTEAIVTGNRVTLFISTFAGHLRNAWRTWMITSDNSGKTWGKPQPLPGRLAAATFIRSHIFTQDGRIVVPFQHYLGNLSDNNADVVSRNQNNTTTPYPTPVINSRNGVIISSDGGKTWTEHGDIKLPPQHGKRTWWAENAIVELKKNHIGMLIRPDSIEGVETFLFRADSHDGGLSWTKAEETDIPNPSSKVALFRLGENTVALLHNAHHGRAVRKDLSLWISFDGMKTWPYKRIVIAESVDGPKARIHYPEGYVTPDKQWLNFVVDDNRHQAVWVRAKLPPLPEKQ